MESTEVSGNRPCNDATQEYKVSFSSGYFSLKTETVIYIRSFKLTYQVPINSLNRTENRFLVCLKRNHWMFIISLGKHVAHLEDLLFYSTLILLSCMEIFLHRHQRPLMKHFFCEVLYERNIIYKSFFLESTPTINLSAVIKRKVCNSS